MCPRTQSEAREHFSSRQRLSAVSASSGRCLTRRWHAALEGGAVPRACHSVRSCLIVGESMTATMKGDPHENPRDQRKSRNLCRRTKHQLRAFVNLRTDKTPAQSLHDSDHEGFMMPPAGFITTAPVLPRWTPLLRRRVDESGNTPAQRLHDSPEGGS